MASTVSADNSHTVKIHGAIMIAMMWNATPGEWRFERDTAYSASHRFRNESTWFSRSIGPKVD